MCVSGGWRDLYTRGAWPCPHGLRPACLDWTRLEERFWSELVRDRVFSLNNSPEGEGASACSADCPPCPREIRADQARPLPACE